MRDRVGTARYNEIEPYTVQWLRNLGARGLIARGRVDARPIQQLVAADVRGAVQFHAFAGLGAWSYALRLAGWPDDRPVWTGSCPCQPFSTAGRGLGLADERHLWPEWFRLVRECRPPVVFGEQVASPAGLAWLDLVRADLEGEGYAVGAADLCAAGVGAPHIRQRLFFGAVRVGNAYGSRLAPRDAISIRAEARSEQSPGAGLSVCVADWLPCRDGKRRPVEPGTFPLAHGAPARVGRLRAYGNAIVPEVAAAFVTAFQETYENLLDVP